MALNLESVFLLKAMSMNIWEVYNFQNLYDYCDYAVSIIFVAPDEQINPKKKILEQIQVR